MIFKTNRMYKNAIEDAADALRFLRVAYEENKLAEIENMEDVLQALDISQDLEYAISKLKELSINY